ncbi:unnamed protein product, partial [Mesorhabditis belari]|uniref:SH3 domain-containing protein n=1 Tax=Mesorhabditis belari TaxID=2138241 RepID=A0AAF3FDK3_9BILA
MHEPQPDYGFAGQYHNENGYANPIYSYEDADYHPQPRREAARLPVKQPPHHYVPISPPKAHLLPAFDQERGVNADLHKPSTAEHIRQVGVPVLPIGQPSAVGVDLYGIVPPSQNKAYLQHLRNHRNFDTMKNLQSVNDCQICQMFLAAEGFQLKRPERPKLNSLQIDIPDEPMEYSLDYTRDAPREMPQQEETPYPVAQPQGMPSPQRPQLFEGLVDSRHRQRVHVKDIFQAPPQNLAPHNYTEPMPNGYSPRIHQHKIIIPAPDYDPPAPDYPVTIKKEMKEMKETREPVKLSGGSDSSKSSQTQNPPAITIQKPLETPAETTEARVLKDYKKRGEGDISVHKNDVVEILESNGRWSRVRTIEGLVGFIPNKYLLTQNK